MMKSCTHPDSGFVKQPRMPKMTPKMMGKKDMNHPLMAKGTNVMGKEEKGKYAISK